MREGDLLRPVPPMQGEAPHAASAAHPRAGGVALLGAPRALALLVQGVPAGEAGGALAHAGALCLVWRSHSHVALGQVGDAPRQGRVPPLDAHALGRVGLGYQHRPAVLALPQPPGRRAEEERMNRLSLEQLALVLLAILSTLVALFSALSVGLALGAEWGLALAALICLAVAVGCCVALARSGRVEE